MAFIEESIANTPGVWQVDLLLETTLAEAQPMIPRVIGKPQVVTGGVALRAYVQDLNWFAYFLAQLDCPVQVLHPPEAHLAVQALANKLTLMALPARVAAPVRCRKRLLAKPDSAN